jgi:hypothetical protein
VRCGRLRGSCKAGDCGVRADVTCRSGVRRETGDTKQQGLCDVPGCIGVPGGGIYGYPGGPFGYMRCAGGGGGAFCIVCWNREKSCSGFSVVPCGGIPDSAGCAAAALGGAAFGAAGAEADKGSGTLCVADDTAEGTAGVG